MIPGPGLAANRGRYRARLLAALAAVWLGAAHPAEHYKNGGPYVPTPQVVVDQMLFMANTRSSDYVIDLGSGDGIIVLTAARLFNAQGVALIVPIFERTNLKEFWEALGLGVVTFRELGLTATTSDREIWRTCQATQTIFLTANRNQDGPDSLEETICSENRPDSLPIFTLANSNRVS